MRKIYFSIMNYKLLLSPLTTHMPEYSLTSVCSPLQPDRIFMLCFVELNSLIPV